MPEFDRWVRRYVRRISVGDVVRIAMSLDDVEEGFDGGSELGRRVVVPLIATLQEDVMKKLDEISIEDICKRARATGLDCGSAARMRDHRPMTASPTRFLAGGLHTCLT